MAGIPWGSIKSILIFFGPILLPKAISYYRTARAAPKQHGLTIQPTPPEVRRTLTVLFGVALVLLLSTLPVFAPENVFAATQSRLQIPVDVLFARLAALRGGNAITAQDAALRAKFVNLESRLLYLQFGPAVLADCPFCGADDPRSYLWYAIPALLLPHVANLVVVAAATSRPLAGRAGAGWRVPATLAAGVLAFADLYVVQGYDASANSRALRLQDLEPFFWRARAWRLVMLALLDGALGWLVWLTATNRAFASPPGPAERVEGVARALAGAHRRLNAAGVVKNATIRDGELRARGQAYWAHEVRLMQDVMEERGVVEGVNDALENRLDISAITRDADRYANDVILPPPDVPMEKKTA